MSDQEPKLRPGKDYFSPNRKKRKPQLIKPASIRWAITVVGWTFVISVALTFFSDRALESASVFVSFFVLLLFIALGIAFDILGIAVATASEAPFHSMASHRVKGAVESLKLIRRAERVSNFCNDVVGDISGIISGATSAAIVARISAGQGSIIASLLVSGIVASVTVGGKALGKSIAMSRNTEIVLLVGKLIHMASAIKRELFPT